MALRTNGPGMPKKTSRASQSCIRQTMLLAAFTLGAVLRPRLFAVGDALGIEDATDDVIADAGQVADAAAADEDNGVFLQIVPLARDVGGDFDPVGEAHASHFPQGRIRLLRRHRLDLQANA